MYAPLIKSARRLREHKLDRFHTAVLMTDIVSDKDLGPQIDYKFLLVIFDERQTDPVAFISSEIFDPRASIEELGLDDDDIEDRTAGQQTHMLCAFLPSGHMNCGGSAEWGKLEKFEPAALELARSYEFIDPSVRTPARVAQAGVRRD